MERAEGTILSLCSQISLLQSQNLSSGERKGLLPPPVYSSWLGRTKAALELQTSGRKGRRGERERQQIQRHPGVWARLVLAAGQNGLDTSFQLMGGGRLGPSSKLRSEAGLAKFPYLFISHKPQPEPCTLQPDSSLVRRAASLL